MKAFPGFFEDKGISFTHLPKENVVAIDQLLPCPVSPESLRLPPRRTTKDDEDDGGGQLKWFILIKSLTHVVLCRVRAGYQRSELVCKESLPRHSPRSWSSL